MSHKKLQRRKHHESDRLRPVAQLVAVLGMIYTHLIAAVIAALAAWAYQDNRYAADLAEMRLDKANAVIETSSRAAVTARAVADKYQGAINHAINEISVLRSNAARAHNESAGLRTQLADATLRLSGASASACTEYASTANELLDQCSQRYSSLAQEADGHVTDARTCIAAWPVTR